MKIDYDNIQGFAFKKGSIAIGKELDAMLMSNYKFSGFNTPEEVPDNWIPAGTVEWCNQFLTLEQSKPSYFPAFTAHYLKRYAWISKDEKSFTTPIKQYNFKKLFIKPADQFKRFDGYIIDVYDKNQILPPGPLYCSEVVEFTEEWRYYISNGKILFSGWYAGDEYNTPDPPKLDIKIPEDWCGTLDMGKLSTGELAIVEAHKPYACGLYTNDYKLYIEWLINGWKHLTK